MEFKEYPKYLADCGGVTAEDAAEEARIRAAMPQPKAGEPEPVETAEGESLDEPDHVEKKRPGRPKRT